MSRQLGEFEQFLLFAVLSLDEDAYGVRIRRHIEERTGRQVSPGAVYTALDRLEAKEYVSSRLGSETPERGGRRKRFFALEPRGAAALLESYRSLASMAEGLVPKLVEAAGAAARSQGAP